MPCAASALMCAGRSRRASRAPWMRGCSVLTRPSSISGKPVTCDTSVTGNLASANSFAVPPVDSSVMPRWCRARANSTMPALSETEISARGMSLQEFVVGQLAAQRVAVDAQPVGGLALIAVGLAHHHLEQRLLDGVHDHLVHRVRFGAAQVVEVVLERVAHALLDLALAHRQAASSSASSLAAGVPEGRRACRSPSWSNHVATAAACASQLSSVFITARNASPPGSARTAQPM